MYIHKLKQWYNNNMFSEGICGEKFTGGVPSMTSDNDKVTCPECLKIINESK